MRAGFSAVAEVELARATDVVVVAERVVRFDGRQSYVVVPGNGAPQRRDIVLGIGDGLLTVRADDVTSPVIDVELVSLDLVADTVAGGPGAVTEASLGPPDETIAFLTHTPSLDVGEARMGYAIVATDVAAVAGYRRSRKEYAAPMSDHGRTCDRSRSGIRLPANDPTSAQSATGCNRSSVSASSTTPPAL